MKRLFGTDGIRGTAGEHPLEPATVRRFGAALATVVGDGLSDPPRVLLGRDTRESGPWLRDAVVSGGAARGADAVDAGVITTPGLAYLTRNGQFDAGVMISASHNPFADNGIKVFGSDGTKLPDSLERRIEELILDSGHPDPEPLQVSAPEDASLLGTYVGFLEGVLEDRSRFEGVRLLLDCANGSAAGIAPGVFRHLGAEVDSIGVSPDGRNINLGCGSLHLEPLSAAVREGGYDVGLAFDGDADRVLAVDRKGRVVDGDYILYLTGRRLRRTGHLRGDTIVATVMSNFWLESSLDEQGIRLLRAPVGDKYVREWMVEHDAVLGGEQSGHVIFREHATTGDGILTGLFFLDTVLGESRPLEQILDDIKPFPQVLLNVRVREKPDLRTHPVIGPRVAEVEKRLEGRGRLVLRYSGTEPVARVLVEGSDPDAVRGHAETLADAILTEIGAPETCK